MKPMGRVRGISFKEEEKKKDLPLADSAQIYRSENANENNKAGNTSVAHPIFISGVKY